jgi:hypothetical protein
MRDFEKVTTDQLWEAIAENARQAQCTTNWVELLDNIKVLCALIDERIEVFQRRMRREQLLAEHRVGNGAGLAEALKRRGGDSDGL